MNKLASTIRCPVCDMKKINRSLLWNYQGINHYFCSRQCLERFKSRLRKPLKVATHST